ncbi:uncharacterized protein LOC127282649 [Leptopilina boulardi]|uniref:uncharacterized protein LOC127282649 n=1 Tax=Leptopilina boulardi TaxID=63433 RepID=UPI0021F5EC36|nr:uncharacterized protein LOC127282649 [Leptopilina boulardi]
MMINKIVALAIFFLTMIEIYANPLERKIISETKAASPLEIIQNKTKETPLLCLLECENNINKRHTIISKRNHIFSTSDNGKFIKRSLKEYKDLDTAAGTNILRPLFVYRQQVEYRKRIKKNNNRGI